jgi:hypothetical protein
MHDGFHYKSGRADGHRAREADQTLRFLTRSPKRAQISFAIYRGWVYCFA